VGDLDKDKKGTGRPCAREGGCASKRGECGGERAILQRAKKVRAGGAREREGARANGRVGEQKGGRASKREGARAKERVREQKGGCASKRERGCAGHIAILPSIALHFSFIRPLHSITLFFCWRLRLSSASILPLQSAAPTFLHRLYISSGATHISAARRLVYKNLIPFKFRITAIHD
jgi:hypothetical protein